MTASCPAPLPSHLAARERFSAEATAARYPDRWRGSYRDRREQRCILAALADVDRAARLLDLPCGTGRLLPLLTSRAREVIAVDVAPAMLRRAAMHCANNERLLAADVLALPFADRSFDAVICNRLFHHFTEPETRRTALAEFARVCSGPIVVSFFNQASLGAWRFRMRHRLRGTTPLDRIPIATSQLEEDACSVGLRTVRFLHVARHISPQCYAVLRRA